MILKNLGMLAYQEKKFSRKIILRNLLLRIDCPVLRTIDEYFSANNYFLALIRKNKFLKKKIEILADDFFQPRCFPYR